MTLGTETCGRMGEDRRLVLVVGSLKLECSPGSIGLGFCRMNTELDVHSGLIHRGVGFEIREAFEIAKEASVI